MPGRPAPRRFSRLSAAASLACTLFARSALAAPEPVRLAWVRGAGAEACASQSAIVEQITTRLGRSPFAADAERSIDACVSHADAGWRAEIYVRDREGAHPVARVLTSEAGDCAAIESAAVLALALAIDPEGALRAPEPSPPVVPAPVPVPISPSFVVDPRSSPPPIAPSPSPSPSPSIDLGASGVALRGAVGLGLLPRAAAGLSLAAHAGISRSWALTAEALWMPEVSGADTRFAFGLSAFALGACASLVKASSADLAACGAVWGGALHAVVRALSPIEPGDRAWAAASVSPRLRLRLAPRVHLEIGAQLVVPLIRRPFTVLGLAEPVFQQSPVAVAPFVGVGANFP